MALHSEFHLPYPNLHLTINTVPDSVAIGVITDREIKLFASILYCMQTHNLHVNFLKQDRHFSSTKDTKSQKVFLPTKLLTTVLNQPTHSQDLERKHLDILGKRSDFQGFRFIGIEENGGYRWSDGDEINMFFLDYKHTEFKDNPNFVLNSATSFVLGAVTTFMLGALLM